MAEKKIQTRIRQKVDTKANWDKATNFVPLKGEIIIYSDLNQAKVGDGTTKVGALPFLKGKADASDKNPTLAWGGKSTVATVDGVDIHVTMPSNPNTHQSIKTLNTNNTSAQTASSSEAIAGSGTINLHKVAKTGSYNDLNNKPTIPAVNNGQLTIQKNGSTVATFTANQSGNATANISVPTKLSDLSERSLGALTSRGEEYLDWGGPSRRGSISPVGAALSVEHSANRLALINPNALTLEYSSDGGTTWTPYSYTGSEKTKICTTTLRLNIGRPDNTTNLVANKSKTRITITAEDGTHEYVYTSMRKMLVNVSTATDISMLVETRTGTNYKNNGAWSSVGTYQLAGWSGWNDIPLGTSLGGYVNQLQNNWQMRLTFSCPTVSSGSPKEGAVLGIRVFGENCWVPASNLAGTGNIYTYDMGGNVSFPAGLSVNGAFSVGGKALATVATSGSYNDLTHKPTIPTVPTNFVTTNTDQTISGTKNFGAITANTIGTGTNANNYFQSQKFRGEGDANTYYHAVDFGYAGHDQVDFYEYGGIYNFYRNQQANTNAKELLFGINPSGIKLPKVTGAKVLGTNADGQVESHTLGIADISSLQSTLDSKMAKSEVSTQQWKLTSTAGTVTTVNICVK